MSCIVAIMCYTGFNQEDSVIFNKSALDRGLATITYFRTFKDEITSRGTEEEAFGPPRGRLTWVAR